MDREEYISPKELEDFIKQVKEIAFGEGDNSHHSLNEVLEQLKNMQDLALEENK